MNTLLPPNTTTRARVLHPGDVVCAERGDRLDTLLGSCIAVVLSDPGGRVGAMSHIVHPGGPADGDTVFGNAALQRMQVLLRSHAITMQGCQAWVLGGGNMFPGRYDSGHVGETNAQWVLQALHELDVPVAGQDLGGNRYRRVRWTVGPEAPQVIAVELTQ